MEWSRPNVAAVLLADTVTVARAELARKVEEGLLAR